jgi:hypothetical protein
MGVNFHPSGNSYYIIICSKKLIKSCTLLLSSIKSTLEKQLSIGRKATIPRDKKQFSFNRFPLIVILYQILLILLFSIIFFLYLYVNWQDKSASEVNSIKQVVNSNFEQYQEMINLINNKINNHDPSNKDLLDVKKYNQLLGLQKNYVNIDEAYIVVNYGNNTLINTIYGEKSFAILPSKDFFSRLESTDQVTPYIEDNILFIGSTIRNSSYSKNSYIVLKLDLDEFIRRTSALLGLVGSFSFSASDIDGYSIHCNFNLYLKYTPQRFYEIIGSNLSIFFIVFLLFSTSLLIYLITFKQYSARFSHYFDIKQSEYKKQITSLAGRLNVLSDYKTKIDISFVSNRKFFNDFLTLYKSSFLEYFNIESSIKEDSVSLTQIIIDCKSILYKELLESEIECEVKIFTEMNVSQEKAIILYILVVNFLYRSLYRTPRKGKVIVSVDKKNNLTFIRIEDNGFDLILKNKIIDNSCNLFMLSELTLEELSINNNINIIKLPKVQNTIIDLVLHNESYINVNMSAKDKNVVIFPKNK